MTLTVNLPAATLRWLQAEAEAQGTDASTIVEEQVALARARAEAQAILNGPFHSIEDANKRHRDKYGLPDLSTLSREELSDRINAGLATLDPDKLAEAERQGLL